MILIIVIIIITVLVVTVVLLKKKKDCSSCIGKSCSQNSDCQESYCDTDTCLEGKCCSADCTGKNCNQINSCGQSCSKCGFGQKCVNEDCCTPLCPPNTCSGDTCGGNCSCDQGYTCVTAPDGTKSCCKPPDCSTGFCGSNECGSCNNVYCSGECCRSNKCVYKDICNSEFGKILKNSWAKFCDTCNNPTTIKCNLTLPQFYPGSFIPIGGTLDCTSDTCNGININGTTQFDPGASYYDFNILEGKIMPNYIGNYCKDENGTCNRTCVCLNNADCQMYGCDTCIGGFVSKFSNLNLKISRYLFIISTLSIVSQTFFVIFTSSSRSSNSL